MRPGPDLAPLVDRVSFTGGPETARPARPVARVAPGASSLDEAVRALADSGRLPRRGKPYWYEVYQGTNLILFGHTPSKTVRARHTGGKLTSLGLDTGCVYGGELTAYCPETEAIVQVSAKRKHARV